VVAIVMVVVIIVVIVVVVVVVVVFVFCFACALWIVFPLVIGVCMVYDPPPPHRLIKIRTTGLSSIDNRNCHLVF